MDQALHDLGEHVAAVAPDGVVAGHEQIADELIVHTRLDGLTGLLTLLRDDSACRFKVLVDITAVDYPNRDQRFEVVYNLLSLSQNQRIRVKVVCGEGEPVPSVTGIFACAGWYEREVWDLFGIPFAGNADLRRILTDYGFEGHPLRKDFPLTGHVEVRYDETQKRVVYEQVKLTQDFRNFDFVSPWEGMDRLLLDDEKADDRLAGDRLTGDQGAQD